MDGCDPGGMNDRTGKAAAAIHAKANSSISLYRKRF